MLMNTKYKYREPQAVIFLPQRALRNTAQRGTKEYIILNVECLVLNRSNTELTKNSKLLIQNTKTKD